MRRKVRRVLMNRLGKICVSGLSRGVGEGGR